MRPLAGSFATVLFGAGLLGASLLPGSAADFGKLVAEETEKWGKVVEFSGAKAT